MKRLALLLAATAFVTPALAADVIYDEPIAAPVAFDSAYTWTGFFAGGQAGAAFNRDSGLFSSTGSSFQGGTNNETGFVGGVHAGYDYQINNFIVGAVADISYVDATSNATYSQFGQTFGSKQDIDFLGTVRAKAGVAADRIAVYATGGLAYASVSNDLIGSGTVTSGGTAYNVSLEDDTDEFGYAVGAGVDYLVTQNVSVGLEYLFTDLGSSKTKINYTPVGSTVPTDSLTATSSSDLDFHTVWAKASYRFN
ncbi:porin family protein [Aureimonas fodinaquatilis]|uniref:Porin family protein n=1 Tax=Aureimonas fodinaquatilis TaxID=2565783 RepID=A0A5B0E2W3_9HYPH|nr:outer membrane beta-barrel protein [Aureimonas fodinaquatilis]KAA0972291.1 porin family protein [Aureimonas fodinaquatilis]